MVNSNNESLDRSQLVKGVLDLAVLSVLSNEDGYGYDVVRRLRSAGLVDVAEASVYGTLRRLFATGMLTSYVVASDEGPHRKYYGMTPVGRDSIAAQRDQWIAFCEVINTISKTKEDN